MVEKIGTIKNPLTIIAIFAAIAEISGTVVLPFVAETNQSTYIWFLMVFPVLLVLLFFLTLNLNHKVLYAPSDFKDEANFFKSFQPASPTEREEKFRSQVREIEAEVPNDTKSGLESRAATVRGNATVISRRDIHARYSLAEDLVLHKISKELGQPVRRDMRFVTHGRNFLFDGVIVTDEKVTVIEVKYFRDARYIADRFKEVFHGIISAAERLPDSMRDRLCLVLAVATDAPTEDREQLSKRLYSMIEITPFPVDVRIFSLEELEREFKLDA